MILPKELFKKIEYFEHTMDHTVGTTVVYDVFTLHFKAWWRKNKVIKIKRNLVDYKAGEDTFSHSPTPGATDLHQQLNDWVVSTFEEKPASVKEKYETNNSDNIITLKPKDEE